MLIPKFTKIQVIRIMIDLKKKEKKDNNTGKINNQRDNKQDKIKSLLSNNSKRLLLMLCKRLIKE